MSNTNPIKSFEPAKGINPDKFFDRIKAKHVIALMGAVALLIFAMGISSVSYKLKKESSEAIDNHSRVEEDTALTYYLTVKEDGVDSTGRQSSDSAIANVSGGVATVTDVIPAGLEFTGFTTTTDGTIGAVSRGESATSCAGHVIDDTKEEKTDGGTWNQAHTEYYYHGLHYNAETRTVSFKAENIQAGCELTVGIITQTPTLGDATRMDFYNTSALNEGSISLNSNTMHVWMGRKDAAKFDVAYSYTGDVPEGAPSAPETQSYAEGTTVNIASSPTVEGYQFSGWQTGDTETAGVQFTMPGVNVTFTGSFTAKPEATKYNVTYVIDGEKPADFTVPKSRQYEAGTLVLLDSLSKNAMIDDYSFNGWTSADVELTEKAFTMPSGDVEIHGSFTRQTHKVTYVFEGETLPPNADELLPTVQEYPAGAKVTLADNPTAEGYSFTGWYQNATFTMPAEDVVIYGEWSVLHGSFKPELSMEVINPEEAYHVGDTVRFAITVKNTADYPIRDVQVVENMAGAVFEESENYTLKTDAYALIPEIPAGESVTLKAVFKVTENEDNSFTNIVELTGALGPEGYALNTDESYEAEVSFDTAFTADPVPDEDKEKQEEADNANTLDNIARYVVMAITGIGGIMGSAFLIRKTLKNDQLKSLKKLAKTKASHSHKKAKHSISPETAKKRLIAFAVADAVLVAGCIGLAIHLAPKVQSKFENSPSIDLFSGRADFEAGEPGAWKLTKSAEWIGDGEAKLTINVDTIAKTSDAKKDIVFAVDTSGSMIGDKINQVRADMSEIVDDLLSDEENQVALVSFESTANLEFGFTSDKELALSAIDGLTTGNNTNYYDALKKVEDALAGYSEDPARELYVLILTDGFPTVDSPNEVREYQYIKEAYPFATVGAIQYEMGTETVYTPIKNISDEQFIADMETLHNTLYDVVAFPYTYTTFTVKDLVNDTYFTIADEDSLSVSVGEASINGQEITWDMGGVLRSGSDAELSIELKLNDNYKRVGGEYPTNTRESVESEIDGDTDSQESTETPVLGNNYPVSYEANAPESCTVSGLPEGESHFVYEVVEVSDAKPTCEGYNFAGFEVTTEDVFRFNKDYFRMPAVDVVLKATWTKTSIEKTMDGTIHESAKLYDTIASKTNGPDTNIDFSKGSSSTNGNGVNTVASTSDDEYPVHYFRGNVADNNVLFAGFCWKAVRTTETGGTKIIYNGVPDTEGRCQNTLSSEAGVTDIGDSRFSNKYNSPAGVGYMYGEVYNSNTRWIGNHYSALSGPHSVDGDKWYADSISYNSSTRKWQLVNPYQVETEGDDYSSLVGKYTLMNNEGSYESSYAYYITDIIGSRSYVISIYAGKSFDSENWSITYGEGYRDNGDGTYSIENPTTIELKDWYKNYEGIQGMFYCKNGTNNSCVADDLYYLQYTTATSYSNVKPVIENYKYSDNFTYRDGKYYLDDDGSVNVYDFSDETEREKPKMRYTCFNVSGICSNNIYYIYGSTYNTVNYNGIVTYLSLSNGVSFEEATERMKENINSSTVKTIIDAWYEQSFLGKTSEKLLEDTGYCNDRSNDFSSGSYSYGASRRKKNPSLDCPELSDYFSVDNANGNGALTYPIGMISLDELTLAGMGTSSDSGGYLYTGRLTWSMSPLNFSRSTTSCDYCWIQRSESWYSNQGTGAIRPVVSIAPDVAIASGDGSQAMPWELEK